MSEQISSKVYVTEFSDWKESVFQLLAASDLQQKVQTYDTVLIKPNLVEHHPPPITTPVQLIDAIVEYLQYHCEDKRIIIGEGCGSSSHDTHDLFNDFGYTKMATNRKVELLDLNEEDLVCKKDNSFPKWKEMWLPKLLDEVFLFSVPQLKAHSLADVTLTMKNMMGCAPPSHYKGNGPWKKSSFHENVHHAIFDLNRYRTPDYSLIDATIGMAEAHLWGPECDPPVGKLICSGDPVAIDSYGTKLLGKNWKNIDHINFAHTVLGDAQKYSLIEV